MEPTRENRNKMRKKKKRKAAIAKLIPVIVAIVLIIVIGGIYYGRELVETLYYSSEQKDLNEFYELYDENDVAIFLQDSYVAEKAKYVNGECYFDFETIRTYFKDRFYVNTEEGIMLYTTATDIYEVVLGEGVSSYSVGDQTVPLKYAPAIYYKDVLHVSAEYLQLFNDFEYEFYPEPNRMLLYTEDTSYKQCKVKKETKIRTHGGVKSPIVAEVAEGEEVLVLEEMEEWTKVILPNGFMGYLENKRIEDLSSVSKTVKKDAIDDGYTPISKDYIINMGFHQVFSQSANNTFEEYTASATGMNVIAPTWFRFIDGEGNFECIASTDYVQKAHAKGMEVWAVFTDVDNKVDTEAIFGTKERRRTVIERMISYAIEYDLDGINIDFETIPAETGDDFVQFLRELSIQTHANGIVLSVDNYAPTASTAHYNRKEQGLVVDYVVVMGYDEHWGGSDVAGSVASIDFVEGGIMRTIDEGVPASKLINAIPFYTRLWKTEGGEVSSEVKGMGASKSWAEDNGVELIWDNTCCQYYGELLQGDALYQIWLEEEESIKTKLNVMKSNGVAGVAEWKLGFEQSLIWDVISEYQNS